MVAEFTANQTSGCAPLSVIFRDLTSGSPRSWNWDFGNGTLSTAQNPVVSFNQPGTYTVTLVVRNPDGTTGTVKNNYITVYPSPATYFNSNNVTGCVPANIQFFDRTTSASGSIVSWEWNFGDGSTSNQQNPSHTYTATGFYNVSLVTTSSTGCKGVAISNRYMRIVSGVKAEFDNTKLASCSAPYNTTFINNSSGPGNMTFQWDLGNGVTSTQSAPSTTYPTAGTYNITLTATSEFGCSGNITKPVTFGGPTTTITAPDTVCQNQPVAFRNGGSVAPQKTQWEFGNGQQATTVDGTATYTTTGDFTVKLFNTYSGCRDSAIKKIHVRPGPVIDFNAINAVACKAPLTVNFQDASPTPITNWQWDFGDGGTGTGASPTHQYNAAGNYNVSVVFTDNKGCEARLTKPAVIKIEAPTVKITSVPDGGCVPFNYTPNATVTAVDGIATYSWDFGDGTVITGTNPSPSHQYTTTGAYTIRLTVTTTGGCTETATEVDGVKVGTPPATDFSISLPEICAIDTARFTDLTPQPVDEWKWEFGDGGTANAQNPTHVFMDSGTLTVKLIAFNNRCAGPAVTKTIRIKPPIAKFEPTIICGGLNVLFADQSKVAPLPTPAATYLWEFGDGTTSTIAAIGSHLYPALGIYPVKLTITQDGCTNFYVDTVKLIKEEAAFTVDNIVCKNKVFLMQSTNRPAFVTKYEWAVDGGGFTTGGPTYSPLIATPGSHTVSLRITDLNGCTDDEVKTITVTGPTANFTPASVGGCKNAVINFNDLSTPSPSAALVKWTFDFGDGTLNSFTTAPYTHIYTDTGAYVVQLQVEDAMGCIDQFTSTDTVFIATPAADFTSNYDTICPTANVQFTDASVGVGLSYFWQFGNGGTSVDKDPLFSYGGNNAVYDVTLIVTDRGGCKDTTTHTRFITTIKPIPAFDILDTLTICPPIETKFTFRGEHYESFEWDFGDGSNSTLKDPTHFYNAFGDYTPKLYLYGYGGGACVDSASATVHVYNPGSVTTLNYSPLDACNELLVDFSLVTIPEMKFSLYFGDGTADSSMATTYQHFYKSPAFYDPYLEYTDKQGCIAGVHGPTIKIIGAEPFFGVDNKKFCDSGAVFFTNYTIGNDPVVSRTWNFGDGATNTVDTDPLHQYRQPGLYIASQTVTTQQGCTKTIADTIRVYRTPDPVIAGDSIACLNANMNLQASLAIPDTSITWKWTLDGGRSLTNQNITLQFPVSGDYSIKLEASNLLGCTDSTRRELYVPPVPTLTVNDNPVIPVMSGATLPVTYGPEVVKYTWTPTKNLSCTDCPNPFADPRQTTKYTVRAEDQYGCTNTADVMVTVVCNGLNYFVPNTFTPNGDGMNDVFAPRGTGLARVNSMRIFNRWGQMVYERMNFMANDRTPTGGWDGTYKGKPASADVYVYIIEFVCENSQIVPVKGNVALVR